MKPPTFFATPADFRAWLAVNHAKEKELLVGFYNARRFAQLKKSGLVGAGSDSSAGARVEKGHP